VGRKIEIRGVVQGVGFRPWIYRLATEQGLAGHVRNDGSGVTIEAFGSMEALDAFMGRLEAAFAPARARDHATTVGETAYETVCEAAPAAAVIRELRSLPIPPVRVDAFRIVHSEAGADRRVSIPPDLPTCRACVAELFDAADRRYRYPFINCTQCGPRFTITRDVPYDRPATTMAAFPMCPVCEKEYRSAGNRRFHAEPNACPACGPRLELVRSDGIAVDHEDPIAAVIEAIIAGGTVAIKGLGGFHLACDASSAAAVRTLRARKRRDEKPFAVMVRDLTVAGEVAVLTSAEQRLLASSEHPIVVATRRTESVLTSEVAPHNPLVGLLLPYTPLHHLLAREIGRPVVMTSGNLSDEPIAYRNGEAVARLGGIADLFLLHDREIEAPCDDSVARIIEGRPAVLRRARGYVPRPILVSPNRFDRPVLACGALLKNTFCIGTADAAYLSPHVGDLENLDTYQAFEASIARLERLVRVAPEVIAYDLHPDCMSTRYALARPEPVKIGVQHHHAHVASAMAEHGLAGPVIGVAFDGSGYGTDGSSWGGEVLVARYESFDRVATLRPIRLAGGDAAVRHPWRLALALLEDAFGETPPLDDLGLFAAVAPHDLSVIRQMLAIGARSPLAHGCGRYFDAIGSLVLKRPESRYEGQIALEWNSVADPAEDGRYGYEIDWQASPWIIDLRGMVRAVVHDLVGVPASLISARFHNTIVAATADAVRAAAAAYGELPVVLTGGCFQNPRLAEGLARALAPRFAVHLHGEVPPGDGGLALGQAVVAAAIARRVGV
jgi:hydrogenase maturation protein HypF